MMTLDQLAIKYGTDKSSLRHGYTKYYEQFFESFRNESITLLEVGYGGYKYPERGGEGHRTWLEYFQNGVICSIDVFNKNHEISDRSLFFQCSQDDSVGLSKVIDVIGLPDVIIDDGSHINDKTIRTFQILFPTLRSKGWYVVEDIESFAWESIAIDGTDFKGCADLNNMTAATILNFLRGLLLDVNEKYIDSYHQKYAIESMHFFANICFIKKR